MNFQTKSEYIYELLKKKITEGEIAQGETITISDVAAENQMSAIPVREALKRLESEGLVDIVPHKGASVTLYDAKKIKEIIAIRGLLEGYAAKCSGENITESELQDLYDMNAELGEIAKAGNDELFIQKNRIFHKNLYSYSDMPALNEMIYNLWEGGNWSKALFAYFPEEMIKSVEEHRAILDAISHKDFEDVERLMRAHKEGNIDLYLKLTKK